jgi:beta-glucosidase
VNYSEGIFLGYRHFDKDNIEPLFPFGFGLSYTTFSYKNLEVRSSGGNGNVIVSFDVTNTGIFDGDEIPQVYVGKPQTQILRAVKELKGFSRVHLKKGEKKHVEILLGRNAFQYFDIKSKSWITEPGDYEILVGASSRDIRLRGTITLE